MTAACTGVAAGSERLPGSIINTLHLRWLLLRRLAAESTCAGRSHHRDLSKLETFPTNNLVPKTNHFSLFASKVAIHTWLTGVGAINEAVARNISLMNCSYCVTEKKTEVCVSVLSGVIYSFPLKMISSIMCLQPALTGKVGLVHIHVTLCSPPRSSGARTETKESPVFKISRRCRCVCARVCALVCVYMLIKKNLPRNVCLCVFDGVVSSEIRAVPSCSSCPLPGSWPAGISRAHPQAWTLFNPIVHCITKGRGVGLGRGLLHWWEGG